jgi:Tfp pilus assembly protein PilW
MNKSFFKKICNRTGGFTLVETIFYLTFLLILLAVVIMLVLSLARTYQTIQSTKNLESSAVFSMERMTREIRNATSVDTLHSVLATSTAGVLALNTTDDSGNPQTVKFYLAPSTGALSVDSKGIYVGPLTLSGVTVNELEFQLSTSTNSQAVKIDLGLTSVVGSASTTTNFYSTIVLRGSY